MATSTTERVAWERDISYQNVTRSTILTPISINRGDLICFMVTEAAELLACGHPATFPCMAPGTRQAAVNF